MLLPSKSPYGDLDTRIIITDYVVYIKTDRKLMAEQPEDNLPSGLTWPKFRSAYSKTIGMVHNSIVSIAWNRYKARNRSVPANNTKTTKKSPKKLPKPEKKEREVFVAWIPLDDINREVNEDRFPILTESEIAILLRELSETAKQEDSDVISIQNEPFRTLRIRLLIPENVNKDVVYQYELYKRMFVQAERYNLESRTILLVIQHPRPSIRRDTVIPLNGTPLIIEARWNVVEETRKGKRERTTITDLEDAFIRMKAILSLYSKSSSTLYDGVRIVDVQLFPSNRLLLTFIPEEGKNVEEGVRKLIEADGVIESLRIDVFTSPLVAIVGSIRNGKFIRSGEDDTRTEIEISVARDSPYFPSPIQKPVASKKGNARK